MTAADVNRIRSIIAGGLVSVRWTIMTEYREASRAEAITRALEPVIDAIVNEALVEAARGVVVVGDIIAPEPCPECGRALDDPFHGGFGPCPST